jgi:hypothetical protein
VYGDVASAQEWPPLVGRKVGTVLTGRWRETRRAWHSSCHYERPNLKQQQRHWLYRGPLGPCTVRMKSRCRRSGLSPPTFEPRQTGSPWSMDIAPGGFQPWFVVQSPLSPLPSSDAQLLLAC